MDFVNNILEAIGNTPLVKLQRLIGPNDAQVFCKCEYLNPSGSIKDRFVVYALDQAMKSGDIKLGGLIVENTSGNTGASIAQWAAVHGVRCIFTIPDKMSAEKINTLKAMGAEVVVCPTNVPASSPQSYYETAKRLAKTHGGYYLNQYHSALNIEAHRNNTGPAIWKQTGGDFDYFVAGLGTGGTMSGAGRFFKEQNPKIKNIGVDPIGSVFYSLFKTGELSKPHVYHVEGIGEDMACGALDLTVLDDMYQVSDRDSFKTARDLARLEGIFAGGSSGSAVWAALQLAKKVGADKKIVVVLTDSGKSYVSKFYADEWMQDNGFLTRPQLEGTVADVLATKGDRALIAIALGDTIGPAIETLKKHQISQMPVVNAKGASAGMLHEMDLLDAVIEGRLHKTDAIDAAVKPLEGIVKPSTSLREVRRILADDLVAVVKEGDRISGILTKIDLLDYVEAQKSANGEGVVS